MNSRFACSLIIMLSCWCSLAGAQSSSELASAFAQHASYSNAIISPDGKHIALSVEVEAGPAIAVINVDSKQPISVIEFTRSRMPGSFRWANNERLIISIARFVGSADVPAFTGELFAINKDGKRGKNIFGYQAVEPRYATGTMLGVLDKRHILVQVNPWGRAGTDKLTEVVKVNIYNGSMRKIVRSNLRGASFFLDRDDEPRFAVGADNNADQAISIKVKGELEWRDFESPFDEGAIPVAFTEDNQSVFVVGALPTDNSVSGLYRYDLKTRVATQIFHAGDSDVENVAVDTQQNVLGVVTSRNYPEFHAVARGHELTKTIMSLIASFPDTNVTLTSVSNDSERAVIMVSSPTRTPEYYLYDSKKGAVEFLFDAFPGIDDAILSPSDAFSIKARDGMELHGYITLPMGEEKKHPLIVMPHGGPHARDYWRYDPSVQMLAASGYAVLQINFRGSTGYGQDFLEAGYGEWGRKIQTDIIDATYWAISSGLADPDRVAIYGASFGGYSALQAPILEPDLYKAAIGYVGVYDLDMLYTTGDIQTTRWGDAYLDKTLPSTQEERSAQSPLRNVDKLKTPLFIVHGVDDPRAAFEHAEALRDALDEINYPYEWLAKDGEGHGFYDVDNRIELNNKVLAFLEKHLN